jgi:hypothetical protein
MSASPKVSEALLTPCSSELPSFFQHQLSLQHCPNAWHANVPNWQILLGVGDDVRTSLGEFSRLAKRILSALRDDDGQRILKNIRVLRERFEPEVVAKERAARPRPRLMYFSIAAIRSRA